MAETGKHLKVLVIEDDPEVVETVSLVFQVTWNEVEVMTAPEGKRG